MVERKMANNIYIDELKFLNVWRDGGWADFLEEIIWYDYFLFDELNFILCI